MLPATTSFAVAEEPRPEIPRYGTTIDIGSNTLELNALSLVPEEEDYEIDCPHQRVVAEGGQWCTKNGEKLGSFVRWDGFFEQGEVNEEGDLIAVRWDSNGEPVGMYEVTSSGEWEVWLENRIVTTVKLRPQPNSTCVYTWSFRADGKVREQGSRAAGKRYGAWYYLQTPQTEVHYELRLKAAKAPGRKGRMGYKVVSAKISTGDINTKPPGLEFGKTAVEFPEFCTATGYRELSKALSQTD